METTQFQSTADEEIEKYSLLNNRTVDFVIVNRTRTKFHSGIAIVGYRQGGGETKTGFTVSPGKRKTIRFNTGKNCTYQANELLFYGTGDDTRDWALKTKTAPDGRCLTRVGWGIKYKNPLSEFDESTDAEIEIVPIEQLDNTIDI